MPDLLEPEYVVMNHSYEGFGMLMDLLSRTAPFSQMKLGELGAAVRLQLIRGDHFAAVQGSSVVGYVGWLPTSASIADAWSKDQALLTPVLDHTADAAALTIIIAQTGSIRSKLIRGVRQALPNRRIFFKRVTATGRDRKTSVLNRG